MSEIFRRIDEFPDYEVTSYGRVIKTETGREMTHSVGVTYGELTVGMTRDGHQYRRPVKNLVARAFVPGETDIFDTPILLDGNRNNVAADNILWRPRWFAWEYTHQFNKPEPWFWATPLVELISNVEYDNYMHAAVRNGLLCRDIYHSVHNNTHVFPTRQRFAKKSYS